MTNLQRIRKERGLTQKQLAELSGVKLCMIQKYESGEKNINHAQFITIVLLSFALTCRKYELLEEDEELINKINEMPPIPITITAQNGTN